MKKIALLYWGKGGNVEHAAQVIYKLLGPETTDLFDVESFDINNLKNYELLIFGGSTVGAENWQDASNDNKWNKFFREIEKQDLSGIKVAAFGLGNQILYPEHFVDGLGIFKAEMDKTNAKIIGKWPIDGYKFTNSEGMHNGLFYGLALDEDNEPELTEERAKKWLERIKKEMAG